MITVVGRFTFFERAFIASTVLWVVVVLATYVGVELESWKAQNRAELGFWLAPFALLALAFRIRPSRWRTNSIIASGVLVVLSALPASCSGLGIFFESEGPVDLSSEPISKRPFGHGELALYRTNCGATCSFGLVLKQERNLVPGLRVARVLGSWYPADSAVVRVISPELVYVEVAPYGRSRPESDAQNLKAPKSLLWQ